MNTKGKIISIIGLLLGTLLVTGFLRVQPAKAQELTVVGQDCFTLPVGNPHYCGPLAEPVFPPAPNAPYVPFHEVGNGCPPGQLPGSCVLIFKPIGNGACNWKWHPGKNIPNGWSTDPSVCSSGNGENPGEIPGLPTSAVTGYTGGGNGGGGETEQKTTFKCWSQDSVLLTQEVDGQTSLVVWRPTTGDYEPVVTSLTDNVENGVWEDPETKCNVIAAALFRGEKSTDIVKLRLATSGEVLPYRLTLTPSIGENNPYVDVTNKELWYDQGLGGNIVRVGLENWGESKNVIKGQNPAHITFNGSDILAYQTGGSEVKVRVNNVVTETLTCSNPTISPSGLVYCGSGTENSVSIFNSSSKESRQSGTGEYVDFSAGGDLVVVIDGGVVSLYTVDETGFSSSSYATYQPGSGVSLSNPDL